MKKKYLILICLIFFGLSIYSVQIPQPKNSQLYTEFTSYRTAKYLKTPVTSSGYIAMDGADKFIFRQTNPVKIEIKKSEGKITYKKEDAEPVAVNSMQDNIFMLFNEPEKIGEQFNVVKNTRNAKDQYIVIPKESSGIAKLIITATDDKIENLEITFTNDSKLTYEFKNTVTGTKPDEKYFQ